MAITLIDAIAVGQADDNPVTATLNSTGANLLIGFVSEHASGSIGTPQDNKGNTSNYTGLTVPSLLSSARPRLWFCTNTPSVGFGHQLTLAGTGVFATVILSAWSLTHATAPFDTGKESSGGNGSGVTAQMGALTPSVDEALFVTGIGLDLDSNGIAIDQGFVTPVGLEMNSTQRGGFFSYKIQVGAAAAQDPTWTSTDNNAMTGVMAVFKPGAGGGVALPFITTLGSQRIGY